MQHNFKEFSTRQFFTQYRDEKKFLELCKQCPNFGKYWRCPPFNKGVAAEFKNYSRVILIATILDSPKRFMGINFSSEQKLQLSKEIVAEGRAVLDAQLLDLEQMYGDTVAFYAGSCRLCGERECQKQSSKPCLYPHKSRLSIEAIGFDVSAVTTKLFDIELLWGEGGKLPQYYTLVSAVFTNNDKLSAKKIENYLDV